MFENLDIFRLAGGLASNAAARQSVIAANVANADTPGYRALDISPFSQAYRAGDAGMEMRRTMAGHLASFPAQISAPEPVDTPGPSSPNGNTVSLEGEMVKAAENRQQHELALSVYQTSLNILRTSLGRGR